MKRIVKLTVLIGAGLVLAMGPVTEASAALPATTVSPAGDYVLVKLPPGDRIIQSVSGTTVVCKQFALRPPAVQGTSMRNRIPTTGNPSTKGPVKIPLTRPFIGNCTAEMFTVSLDMSATTSGTWAAVLQHKASGGNAASVRIPQGGLVVQTSGAAACTYTAAPDGPAFMAGTWVNGADGAPSQIMLNAVPVPVNVTGGGVCQAGSQTGFITVTLNVTDVTNASSTVTVS